MKVESSSADEAATEFHAQRWHTAAERIVKRFKGSQIQILNGPYGPYITDGKKNARVPKDKPPTELTLEECEQLIAHAPERKARRRVVKKKARA